MVFSVHAGAAAVVAGQVSHDYDREDPGKAQ